MLMRIYLCSILFCFTPALVLATELEGDQLYRVTTVRAAPGSFALLLDGLRAQKTSDSAPLVLRHSQGDHWDLMIIEAIQSSDVLAAGSLHGFASLIAFEEDHYAYGPSWTAVKSAYENNGFFHIEMFHAVAGKAAELIQERRMENAYLITTGQTPNMIFRRAAGSDVDSFTIGFHRDMEAFAASSDTSDDEKEAAARAAGFKSRADISFYLRSLISSHHDTLAVRPD
jgi:hypothetical protein